MFFYHFWVGHIGTYFWSILFIFWPTHALFFTDSGDINLKTIIFTTWSLNWSFWILDPLGVGTCYDHVSMLGVSWKMQQSLGTRVRRNWAGSWSPMHDPILQLLPSSTQFNMYMRTRKWEMFKVLFLCSNWIIVQLGWCSFCTPVSAT